MTDSTTSTYKLHHVFHFPTNHGSTLAVAVPAPDASMLLSFYSILVNSAVGQLWAIVIIMGVYATLKQPPEVQSHNAVVASVGVLNAKRPLDVGALTVNYLYKLRRKSPWSLLIWLAVSIFALVASVVVPALVGRSMILGHGAPVDAQKIYVPIINSTREIVLRNHVLEVPSVLRAAGSVQLGTRSMYSKNVQIDAPAKLEDRPDIGDGEYTSRYNYRYQVSAKDFGLQHYTSLALNVKGSCVTEYSWFNNSLGQAADSGRDFLTDSYLPWKGDQDDSENYVYVSSWNAMPPMGYFRLRDFKSVQDDGSHRNTSFAIIVSSVDRFSNTQGKDPLYLTRESERAPKEYIVRSGRPVLSCWQDDTWTYKGHNFSVAAFNRGNTSIDDFPHPLGKIFSHFLLTPKIVTVGLRLSTSALHSATAALGFTFDAGRASAESDLTHLVLTAYIATKNTLADTTLFEIGSNPPGTDIPNIIEESERNDVSGFVIYSRDISALSLPVIISVPIIVIIMFIIAYLMTTHPWFPWHVVQGYQATILYSLLDEKMWEEGSNSSEDIEKGKHKRKQSWNRKTIAWFEGTRSPGRHASIVAGPDGRPMLAAVDRDGAETSGQRPDRR